MGQGCHATVVADMSEVSVPADNANVIAAILGATLGLVLAVRLGFFRAPDEVRGPVPVERTRPTAYASTHQPSAAPIFGAVGLTLFGVGLAVESSFGVFSLGLVIPGAALLALAVFAGFRRHIDTRGP